MKMKALCLIVLILIAAVSYKTVLAVDVKERLSEQFLDGFPKEWVVNFDSARINLITDKITVKGIEFPSTGSTIDSASFTNLSGMDSLPDTVVLSLSGVRDLPALLSMYLPDIDWDDFIAATVKDGIKGKDLVGDFSVRLERENNNAVFSVFGSVDYVQNLYLSVTLRDVHSVLNGGFGRSIRVQRLAGKSGGLVSSVVEIVGGLSDSRGINVEVANVDFKHTIVGINSTYESLVLMAHAHDVDLFFDALYQHRQFGSVESGTMSVFIDTPFSFYNYKNSDNKEKVVFIKSHSKHKLK